MFARKEIAGVVAAAMIAIVAVPCSLGQFSSGPKKPIGPWMDKTLTLKIDPLYLSIFDGATDRWMIVPGEYKVMAGPSSATLPLTADVTLK